MTVADRVELAGQGELLGGVLADRLEQLVLAAGLVLQQQRLLDEPAGETATLRRALALARAHRVDRREVEPAGEHGHPSKQPALVLGQQGVAPLHGGAQRSLRTVGPPRRLGQQVEQIVEMRRDVLQLEPGHHAAASSMASGSPSTRRQISPIRRPARSVSSDACVLSPARSRNRRTAGHASISARLASVPATVNGASRWFSSSTTHSGSRLVASTCRRGSRAVRSSTSSATAETTCSQLSSTSRRSRSASHPVSAVLVRTHRRSAAARPVRPPRRRRGPPTAARRARRRTRRRETAPDDSAATASASAVLPTPPGRSPSSTASTQSARRPRRSRCPSRRADAAATPSRRRPAGSTAGSSSSA